MFFISIFFHLFIIPNDTVSHPELIKQINLIRSSNCLCGNKIYAKVPEVKWNDKLEKAAKIHAKEIYKRNLLTHKGLNGSNAAIRIKQQQYNWRSYAENIAMGYDNISEVMKAWVESPSHCKNLMGNYTEVGVAKVGDYWVMELASPLQ